MARDITKGQSYPLLGTIKDENTRTVLRLLMDQINELRQPAATQDLGGNTITGSGAATTPTTLTPKSYVDTSVAAVRTNLSASGSTPLDVTALRGQLSQVQRAKLRILPADTPFPVGQDGELAYQLLSNKALPLDGNVLLYYDSNTNTWIPIFSRTIARIVAAGALPTTGYPNEIVYQLPHPCVAFFWNVPTLAWVAL